MRRNLVKITRFEVSMSLNITSFAQISPKQSLKYNIFFNIQNHQIILFFWEAVSKRPNGNHVLERRRISKFLDYSTTFRYRPYNAESKESLPKQPWIFVYDIKTTEFTLKELSFGKHYEIEVDSVSNEIHSHAPLTVYQTIALNAVANVEAILDAENVILEDTHKELSHGKHYEIEADSIENKIHSPSQITVNQTIVPNAVANVESIFDTESVTLEWPRPKGQVDQYQIKWYPLSNPEDVHEKEVSVESDVQKVVGQKDSVLIGELHPGMEYMFEITSEANSVRY